MEALASQDQASELWAHHAVARMRIVHSDTFLRGKYDVASFKVKTEMLTEKKDDHVCGREDFSNSLPFAHVKFSFCRCSNLA